LAPRSLADVTRSMQPNRIQTMPGSSTEVCWAWSQSTDLDLMVLLCCPHVCMSCLSILVPYGKQGLLLPHHINI